MSRNYPEGLRYTKDHEWCRVEGEAATIGITWHAQDALGDIVFVELPKVGEMLKAGDVFGTVESVKAVSELFAPVSGKVVERNEQVVEAPEGLNEDCYDDGWMIRVELSDPSELDGLMSSSDYVEHLENDEE